MAIASTEKGAIVEIRPSNLRDSFEGRCGASYRNRSLPSLDELLARSDEIIDKNDWRRLPQKESNRIIRRYYTIFGYSN